MISKNSFAYRRRVVWLLNEAKIDDVQIDSLFKCADTLNLVSTERTFCILFFANSLMKRGVRPADYWQGRPIGQRWQWWPGSDEEILERLRKQLELTPDDGYFVWFCRSLGKE